MHFARALITDLDNTLYDWVTFFAEASFAMAEAASHVLGTSTEEVLRELKVVHERYGDTEHPYALLETMSVVTRWGGDRGVAKHHLQVAFDSFNRVRDDTLRLYPGTEEMLAQVHEQQCPIIGHTEANVLNASFRLRKLGVLPLFTRLYALEHVGLEHPEPVRSDPVQRGTDAVRILSRSDRKPDPQVLRSICVKEGLAPAEVVYVGDSISRDVGMAKSAGCFAAWAKYGASFSQNDWNRIVTISHWSQDDVARAEKARRDFGATIPDAVLDMSMQDLRSVVTFTPG